MELHVAFMNFTDYTINMITWSVMRDLRVLSLDCKAQNTKPITTPLTVRTAIFGSPEIIQTLILSYCITLLSKERQYHDKK